MQVRGTTFELMLDDTTTPGVRPGVAHGAGNALEQRELEHSPCQGHAEGIESNGIRPPQVAVSVTKAPDMDSVGQRSYAEQRCGVAAKTIALNAPPVRT